LSYYVPILKGKLMRNIEVNLKNEFATVLLQNKPGYLLKTQMPTVSKSGSVSMMLLLKQHL
jgi:hypothetical protein